MTNSIDEDKIRKLIVTFLKNQDIFTTTQRGVTTTSDTGTFAGDTTYSISRTNVKNIRSIVVGATTLSPDKDYDADYASTACLITFTSAQTGAYTITYDYGNSDKIYSDFPQEYLSITNFPRIGTDLLNITTDPGGFGNVTVNKVSFTVVVYDTDSDNVRSYIKAIRTAFIANFTQFQKTIGVIRPTLQGPMLLSPRERGKDKVFQKNIDFTALFNYERN